jgi:HK97 family phage major capsid protein
MPTLVEVREEIAAKNHALHEIFEQAGPERDLNKVEVLKGFADSTAKAAEIKRRNDELTELGKKRDELAAVEEIATATAEREKFFKQPVNGITFAGAQQNGQQQAAASGDPLQGKSLRQIFAESEAFKAFQGRPGESVRLALPEGLDAKTLITLTTISPQTQRIGMQPMVREERTIIDLMIEGRTDSTTVEYYEQTGFTNNAAETAETATKPESALAWTLRTATARDIAHWIPMTKQSIRDNAFLETQVRGELAFGIRRREETQVLTGDGIAPNLKGLLNVTGLQTQAKGADPVPDAVYKAMQKVRGAAGSGFAEPTAAVFHPNDWTDVKLLRTADGIYIWGSPSDDGPDRIWSLPVRQTTALTENTALVGAFRPYAQFLRRGPIEIIMSTEHSTYVIENKVLLLAEEQAMFLVTRGSAFATVTGI